MLKTNGRNVVSKDEIIFKEGDALTQIGIVLSGKVVMQGENIRLVKSNGSYLALNSLESQVYSATYTVLEDAVIYALPVQGEASIRNIIAKNADYRAIMVSSQFKTAVELYRIKSSYLERAERLCSFLQRSYEEYKGICAAYNVPATGIEELEQLQPYEDTLGVNEHKIKYYEEAAKIPLSADNPEEIHMLLSGIVDEFVFQHKELESQTVNAPIYNMDLMKRKMEGLVSEKAVVDERSQEEREADLKRDMESLKGSIDQILKFASSFNDEDGFKLKRNVDFLVKAPDRMSVDDDVKKAKKTITPLVFKLYLCCYRKIKEGLIHPPKAVELFMNFGMLDERLLDEEHLRFLCSVEPEENKGPCKVVTMMEWLDMIHDGKRDPSKSEFDEDYVENLRSLKKQGEITEKEQKVLLNDMNRRVEYEIMNMQMSNSRTIYGQPSSYMPILYKDAIFGYLDKILVTKKKINESVERLVKLDYSVFYREVIYSNTACKITNETVLKNVYPDVILFPLFGTNASMWQEVGSKNKGTPGRFCFPVMTSSNIDELMVKMFGRFRWELCRCIQGMAWNDVKVKSLTSEYMDYIQFYRKNRELSDDARDKVKLQIQKARNNSRETFLLDYEAWIKNEANGSMKMNKVAREILATYCPFEKELRMKLNAQRPYEAAQARSFRNAQKKKQEFELKIKSLQKVTQEIPDEIMDTYKFYSDL